MNHQLWLHGDLNGENEDEDNGRYLDYPIVDQASPFVQRQHVVTYDDGVYIDVPNVGTTAVGDYRGNDDYAIKNGNYQYERSHRPQMRDSPFARRTANSVSYC